MGSPSPSDNGGETEESCNKRDLPNDVVFLQPPHLSLADHVHRLHTLNRSRGRIERAKSLTGSHPSFDRSVILLHDVVEVADRTTPAASSEFSGTLESSNDLRIGRIPIHLDHPWAWVASSCVYAGISGLGSASGIWKRSWRSGTSASITSRSGVGRSGTGRNSTGAAAGNCA